MIEKFIVEIAAIGWGIFEIINGIRGSSNKGVKKDKGSLLLVNVVMFLGYLVSFTIYFSTITGNILNRSIHLTISGLIIFLIGLIIRVTAIVSLKGQFKYNVTIVQEHQLINSGIYKIIRHPAYLGTLLALTGIGVAMNNWICILIMTVPNFLAISYRIRIEEKVLIEHFGSKYKSYMKTTKGVIPFIY